MPLQGLNPDSVPSEKRGMGLGILGRVVGGVGGFFLGGGLPGLVAGARAGGGLFRGIGGLAGRRRRERELRGAISV